MQTPRSSRPSRPQSYWLRLLFLVGAFAAAASYAIHELRNRDARSDWSRTLRIALVLVEEDAVDPAAVELLRKAVPDLEARLEVELGRYRRAAPVPFKFVLHGPVAAREPPPAPLAPGAGFIDLARHAYAIRHYASEIDQRANVVRGFDSRIYVLVRRPGATRLRFVEGESEQGGRVGIARADLDASSVGFTLFVAAHELFHTLGATDKYDDDGQTIFPDGFAEPGKVPVFPQSFAELMAQSRPVSPTEERAPGAIGELAVGAVTATEIGWLVPVAPPVP